MRAYNYIVRHEITKAHKIRMHIQREEIRNRMFSFLAFQFFFGETLRISEKNPPSPIAFQLSLVSAPSHHEYTGRVRGQI